METITSAFPPCLTVAGSPNPLYLLPPNQLEMPDLASDAFFSTLRSRSSMALLVSLRSACALASASEPSYESFARASRPSCLASAT